MADDSKGILSSTTLPVIIAGAGPCGLVAAVTLQQHSVPFRIFERASRSKLCSNAGSGIDMAPTALQLLEDELEVNLDEAMRPYDYMYVADMKGKHVVTLNLRNLKTTTTRSFGFAGRAGLQKALLDRLEDNESDEVLQCGVSVKSYTQHCTHVDVVLSDGKTVQGSVLLACDGIHSAVRSHMHKAVSDELNYCGQECWWGKTTVVPGSELDKVLRQLEEEQGMEKKADGEVGCVAITCMSTHKRPGGFFSCPLNGTTHAWVYFVNNPTSPLANQSDDFTRRGGSVLSEEEKQRELRQLVTDRADFFRCIIEATPASDITRAGLFDRSNLDLPYVDGRVALLGDAAHPQSPMMGQGAVRHDQSSEYSSFSHYHVSAKNMAIVDGYVMAKRLSSTKLIQVEEALRAFDSAARRKANNKVIKEARTSGRIFASKHRFTCWAAKVVLKYLPASTIFSELIKGDNSNKAFIQAMKEAIGSVE